MGWTTSTLVIVGLTLTVILLSGLLAGISVRIIYSAVRDLADRVDKLEETTAEIETLREQIAALEDRRRHPYPTANGLEDGIVIALDVLQEFQASRAYTEARVQQLQDVLARVRANPHGYRERNNNKIPYEHRGR